MQISAIEQSGMSQAVAFAPPPTHKTATLPPPTAIPGPVTVDDYLSSARLQISALSPTPSQNALQPSFPAPEPSTSLASSPMAAAQVPHASIVVPQSAQTSAAPVQTHGFLGSNQVTTLAASYSATVSGKNYPGSVEETAGTYIASVPVPPGASATGSSVEAAEHNLNIILDALG